DFSGYTDIGRGSAQLFGFQVPENFAAPYLARNLAVFWRRWHMSLSSWLRDYLFIPLGGSRGSRPATYRNLFLTMTLGGLWHGAAWHFVAWGAFQGAGLVALRAVGDYGPGPRPPDPLPGAGPPVGWLARVRAPLLAALAVAVTFHFTCLGWVLFRADTLATVAALARRMLLPVAAAPVYSPGMRGFVLGVGLAYFAVVGGQGWLLARLPGGLRATAQRWDWAWRPAYYTALVVWMVVFPAAAQRFIYFQF
ncbi:MAG TPA: MBOAT family O-acyltransferase, partial [Chloroflexia bacterium]|nr:MBOAT family O-acyltransferase [Chloroflexia bacterium]